MFGGSDLKDLEKAVKWIGIALVILIFAAGFTVAKCDCDGSWFPIEVRIKGGAS